MNPRLLRSGTVLFLAMLLLLALLRPAAGDIGPTANPSGAGIRPDGGTQVRMERERVEIAIQPAQDDGQDASFALVTADFFMRNMSDSVESMRVRFPLNDAPVAWMSGDTIKAFQAWVNEQPVESTFAYEEEDMCAGGCPVSTAWAYFDVDFPPGELLAVRVCYTLQPTRYAEEMFWFHYYLETGRDWQGTIGHAEIVLDLPYAANLQNVRHSPAGSQFSGNQLVWVKENFEPEEADNFTVRIVPPLEWLAASGAQGAVPEVRWDDWQAMYLWPGERDWSQYQGEGMLYLNMAALPDWPPDQPRPAFSVYLADLGIAALRKSAQLEPNQRLTQLGLASLLLLQAGEAPTREEREAILAAYQQALVLPPSSDSYLAEEEAQRLAALSESLQRLFPDQVAGLLQPSPTNTSTAAPLASLTTTVTKQVALTSTPPAATSTKTPVPPQETVLPVAVDRGGKTGLLTRPVELVALAVLLVLLLFVGYRAAVRR